jgi:hypothetical protein
MESQDIDKVRDRLALLVDWSLREDLPLGCFAALLRLYLRHVQRATERRRFAHRESALGMVAVAANRYLESFDDYRRGRPLSRGWKTALEAGQGHRPLYLQQVLVGLNMHLSFDLGLAAARSVGPASLAEIHEDFTRLGQLWDALLDRAQDRLARVSPWLRLLDRCGGRDQEQVLGFRVDRAMRESWQFAEHLSSLAEDRWEPVLQKWDGAVATLSRQILKPSGFTRGSLHLIRLRESGRLTEALESLSN